MKLSELTEGTHIRVQGRVWAITLTCPLCEDAQIEDTDHVEQVTAPTQEEARKLLVDHILNTDDDVAHDDVTVVEYLVKHLQ